MSDNIVICGDCLSELKKLEELMFDLIVADPPFNKGKDYGSKVDDNKPLDEYYQWCESWIALCFRLLKPTGSFYLYINSQHLGKIQTIMAKYGIWQNTVVWPYANSTPDKKRFPKSWSCFLFFSKTDDFYFNPKAKEVPGFQTNPNSQVKPTRLSDLWLRISKLTGGFLAQKEAILVPGTHRRRCVYQLPKELLERIILSSSKVQDLVLDLFGHSGTTSVMAKELKRNSIAIEINKDFCDVIKRRLSATSELLFVEEE